MQFWNTTNWIIGFVGLALTVWTIFRNREVKRMVIGHRSVDAAAAIPERSIQPKYIFDDGVVRDKVYFSYFYIVNKGTKTLISDDFRKTFSVKMESSSALQVLKWSTVGTKNSSGIEISKAEDAAEWHVKWSHLDPGQSITVEAYTDAFVEVVTSDGEFSYQTKLVDADRHWSRQHSVMMAVMVLLVSGLFLWRPVYYMLSTGNLVDLKDDRWSYIPSFILTMVGFLIVTSAISWIVDQFKPGPRYIPPVG